MRRVVVLYRRRRGTENPQKTGERSTTMEFIVTAIIVASAAVIVALIATR